MVDEVPSPGVVLGESPPSAVAGSVEVVGPSPPFILLYGRTKSN